MAATKTRCLATTRAGEPCKNFTTDGSDYCHIHQVLADPAATNGTTPPADTPPMDDEAMRRQLAEELDRLIAELQEKEPAFAPPPFSPQALINSLRQNVDALPPAVRVDILYRLREAVRNDNFDLAAWQGAWFLMHYWQHLQRRALQSPLGTQLTALLGPHLQKLQGVLNEDLLDADTWKGLWFMVSYSLQYQLDVLKRRATGDYMTDEFGLDWDFLDAVRPLLSFLYKYYWRIQTSGLENVPDSGRALLVMNHSGQFPFDGAMVMTAVMLEHPSQRLVRNLYADWFATLPFLSSAFEKIGQALATVENGARLLEQDELVGIFPEGYKGSSKLYQDRYRLARFGRGGFIRMALKTGAPLIPVAIVGAEEIYMAFHQSQSLANLFSVPFFPLTLRFPWLGLLGAIPLPTKWTMDFGRPLSLAEYGPEAANDPVLVSQLADQMRNIIQEMVHERLAQRRNPFLG